MARTADVAARAHLDLPDGSAIEFEIRRSDKARSLRLKISARHGLVVTVPHGLEPARVMQLVAGKAGWITGRLAHFAAIRHLVSAESPVRPQAFDLPALAESWRVEYKETCGRTVGARIDRPGRILVSGAVDDVEGCQAALRRWLARHAKDALPSWLSNLSQQSGLRYKDLAIKNQRTRWGSCTPHGRISLNCKLLFLPRELVRYVMAHELCHLLEANHSERFWVHLRHFEPAADALHGRMRDAWKLVPAWAQRGSGVLL
jgi:predicted metal-dependent hydrolase